MRRNVFCRTDLRNQGTQTAWPGLLVKDLPDSFSPDLRRLTQETTAQVGARALKRS
jgi:hypothetical protein